jgi:hypothetical protein
MYTYEQRQIYYHVMIIQICILWVRMMICTCARISFCREPTENIAETNLCTNAISNFQTESNLIGIVKIEHLPRLKSSQMHIEPNE